MTVTIVAVFAVAFVAVLLVVGGEVALYRKNQQLQRQLAAARQLPPPALAPPPRKSAEEQQNERLEKQLQAVMRETVKFSTSPVMGRGEFDVFRAALNVTRQPRPRPRPTSTYPFYVFPQVSLGQIIRTDAPLGLGWQAEQAHRAINSKRCDLLIADLYGNPVAVLEYLGTGHDIGSTAERRDRIKRIALERAGVRFVEIKDGATQAEIQQTIRDVMTRTPA